jgi:hypothetical protein
MSARATATSPAEAQGKKKDGQHDSGSRITPRASIVGLVILVAVAPARAYLDQRAEQQRLTQQVDQLEASNAALEQRLAQLRDPVELERLARECLGLVDPGEIAFVSVRHGQAPVPPSCD